jgi:DNA modification methylase
MLSFEGGFGVTFRESKRLPVHGWYPYVEGFSARYVHDVLHRFDLPASVHDPFGGAGTTQLTASLLGVPSSYAEVNPFMAFVAETKVTAAAQARRNLPRVRRVFSQFLEQLHEGALDRIAATINLACFETTFPGRDFFEERPLRHLLAARSLAATVAGEDSATRDLLYLACAANVVRSSNMTRRADLRRRRTDEYRGRVVDVAGFIRESVERMLDDIEQLPEQMAPMTRVAVDCREGAPASVSMVITSPPYLNGTNYIRNTKLELWFLGFLHSEAELASLRQQTLCAGINDVSRARGEYTRFERVEEVAARLDRATRDRRIPLMVRYYFSDMRRMFERSFGALAPGGRFVLDIGDSAFYGVHVPTDELLIDVALSAGFALEHRRLLARRCSRGNVERRQFEVVLRKPWHSTVVAAAPLESRIEQFAAELPYTVEPYVRRNWGHGLHSLCSYQGKLKPALAHWLIRCFVPSGSRILDPLGGVGTVAFEAALAGHRAVSNDKSPFAAVVARAKLDPPSLAEALAALEELGRVLQATPLAEEDYEAARFGLNGCVADYYHADTLAEVLKARKVFLAQGWGNRAQTFLWASLLHILHGNRPYALSRTSHPVTPFAPSGPAEYRPLLGRLRARVERALAEPLSECFHPGIGIHGDFRSLPRRCEEPFDAIITSPPFLGMRFDRPNWLRMWFCGWGEKNFHEDSRSFLEREQARSLDCYRDFFAVCCQMLRPNGLLIVHIGSGNKDGKLIPGLLARAAERFTLLANVRENVQAVEKHGLKDKGRTEAHHLLFFRPLLGCERQGG